MLLEKLAKQSGVSVARLLWLEKNASKLYKTYQIPKKTGGFRTISQPTPELKSVQRWIVRNVARIALISDAATAYRKGASIRSNAAQHMNTSFTVHFDFSDFFPSFSDIGVRNFLISSMNFSEVDANFVSCLVTRHGSMTIGSPSSPMLTNIMMYDFDQHILNWCEGYDLIYTRYADDLNISAFQASKLESVEGEIIKQAAIFQYAELKLNQRKTSYTSKKYRRSITGINITPDQKLSIGRDRKRYIKHLIHMHSIGGLNMEEAWRLGGLVAFANDAEPEFLMSLQRKYGETIIARLLHRKV